MSTVIALGRQGPSGRPRGALRRRQAGHLRDRGAGVLEVRRRRRRRRSVWLLGLAVW